ncbi:hypothetical protein tpqmel_0013 [Candidatus Gastranaerophilus sp. (ex Termes propinquus)]|nr:hypothetical protein tpqmel_0013 [Candidatus Gastranaerophilus sp. (ex Termes propinquus)]
MDVVAVYIYEIQKGTKPMALVTLDKSELGRAVTKIQRSGLCYSVQDAGGDKANIFFGTSPCVEAVRGFADKKLSELSAEEDFMLGTMLGYCTIEQCERYLRRKVVCEKSA